MASGSQQTATTRRHTKSIAENVKETLESIVVAFILAFVFRAFIVEAFVIPTGSMAPTLYGDQATNTCSMCGYEYARGLATEEVINALRSPGHTIRLRCPNCDTMFDQIPFQQIRRPDSGDRILVQKCLFGVASEFFGPDRWDVTVFKDPRDGVTNFIKRMVGLPGEVLEIIDGDIYTVSIETLEAKEPGLVDHLDGLRQQVAEMGQSNYPSSFPVQLTAMYEQVNSRLLPYLKIAPKSQRAQESLWFNVYNHDFMPVTVPSSQRSNPVGFWPDPNQPQAQEAWDTSRPEITFASESDTPLAIQFGGKPIDDFVAYNYSGNGNRSYHSTNNVGDLRLGFLWFPDVGSGGISLMMNRGRDTFVAEIQRDGNITLQRHAEHLPGKRLMIAQVRPIRCFVSDKAYQIEFTNVDYRVSLKIDGQEVIATNEAQYAPDLVQGLTISRYNGNKAIPSEVRIAAHNLRFRLRHLTLDRDVYYQSTLQPQEWVPDPATQTKVWNPYYHWAGWGTAGMPIMLRSERVVDGQSYCGEYFMLGDNSSASKDSRLWWEIGPHLQYLGTEYQLGTVLSNQLIGKAFFVYWPAGYRPSWSAGIGLIPNFGRMRWIR